MEELREIVAIPMKEKIQFNNIGKTKGNRYTFYRRGQIEKIGLTMQRLCLLSIAPVKEGGFALNGDELVYVQEIYEGFASIGSQRACPFEQLKAVCDSDCF